MKYLFSVITLLFLPSCPLAGEEQGRAVPETWQREISRLESETGAQAEITGTSGYETWSVRDIFICLLVLGVVAAALYFLNRWRMRLEGTPERGAEIAILSKRYLDQRNVLYVARVRGKDYLLAAGQQGANLLTELPEPEHVAATPEPPAGQAAETGNV